MLNNENRCSHCFDNLQICIWSNYPAPSIAGMSSILTVIGKITFATQPLTQRRVSWNTKFKFNTIFFCLFDSIFSFLALLVNENLWPLTWRITATAWAAHLQHEQSEFIHLRTKPAKGFAWPFRWPASAHSSKRYQISRGWRRKTNATYPLFARTECFGSVYFFFFLNPSIPDMTKKHKHL